uniref:Uncharacterized protein n=1 Tax=Chrysotila carterae TaxID=13221 RepID=A0A7S4ESS9_CHRCT
MCQVQPPMRTPGPRRLLPRNALYLPPRRRTSKELYASGGKDSVIRETSHQSRHTSIHAAMHMRSPMVATIFPTPKERMQRAAESKPRAPALGETQQFADTSVKRAPETTRVTKTENEDGRTSEQLMEETILEAAQRFDEVVG